MILLGWCRCPRYEPGGREAGWAGSGCATSWNTCWLVIRRGVTKRVVGEMCSCWLNLTDVCEIGVARSWCTWRWCRECDFRVVIWGGLLEGVTAIKTWGRTPAPSSTHPIYLGLKIIYFFLFLYLFLFFCLFYCFFFFSSFIISFFLAFFFFYPTPPLRPPLSPLRAPPLLPLLRAPPSPPLSHPPIVIGSPLSLSLRPPPPLSLGRTVAA